MAASERRFTTTTTADFTQHNTQLSRGTLPNTPLCRYHRLLGACRGSRRGFGGGRVLAHVRQIEVGKQGLLAHVRQIEVGEQGTQVLWVGAERD